MEPEPDSERNTDRMSWHSKPVDDVFSRLHTDPGTGLDSDEARRRLEEHGPNNLPETRRRGPLMRFLLQFHNVLIYVLLVSSVVTALMQHWIDTGVILAVVMINALVGFIQEGKAEQAIENIKKMLTLEAVVLRNGEQETVPSEDLVPGDVVFLQSGDKVPADLRIIQQRNLQVDEAALTGESVAMSKQIEPVSEGSVLGDRTSMVFHGTHVTSGRARGVVVETGIRTELGRIQEMMEEVEELTTPLLRQIDRFGYWLSGAILGLGTVLFGVGYLFRDYSLQELFLMIIALTVAAIPEGLPAIMSIILAIGVQRMAGRNAIIRRLPAVETLGAVTAICTDKTGTLTRNEMTVRSVILPTRTYTVRGAGYEPSGSFLHNDQITQPQQDEHLMRLIRAGVLCNEARLHQKEDGWQIDGDPTEGALLTLGGKTGIEPTSDQPDHPQVDLLPFESEQRYMATLNDTPEGRLIVVKGAPETILDRCEDQLADDGRKPLERNRWDRVVEEHAAQGQRILALACRTASADQDRIDHADIDGGFTFLGLVGMIDPPRDETVDSIRRCHDAGIRVLMITGDHALTARAIAEEIGLKRTDRIVTGEEIDRMDDEALQQALEESDVFARTSPEHKLRLVKMLQSRGNICAMTGDGVNDAPSLKRADVGVAMGIKGTEVSKDAAQMVLADDNFSSISQAVEEGRTVYDNLKKSILFLLPTNGGEASVIFAALVLGLTLPMTPVHVLWVNMITAVTLALALAFEATEPGTMNRPPRDADEPIISLYLAGRIGLISLVLGATVLAVFNWCLAQGHSVGFAQAAAVNTLVAGEAFYLLNSRFIMRSCLNSRVILGSPPVLIAIGLVTLFQLGFTYVPVMQYLFSIEGITFSVWLLALASGLLVFLVAEAEKWVTRTTGFRAAPLDRLDQHSRPD